MNKNIPEYSQHIPRYYAKCVKFVEDILIWTAFTWKFIQLRLSINFWLIQYRNVQNFWPTFLVQCFTQYQAKIFNDLKKLKLKYCLFRYDKMKIYPPLKRQLITQEYNIEVWRDGAHKTNILFVNNLGKVPESLHYFYCSLLMQIDLRYIDFCSICCPTYGFLLPSSTSSSSWTELSCIYIVHQISHAGTR